MSEGDSVVSKKEESFFFQFKDLRILSVGTGNNDETMSAAREFVKYIVENDFYDLEDAAQKYSASTPKSIGKDKSLDMQPPPTQEGIKQPTQEDIKQPTQEDIKQPTQEDIKRFNQLMDEGTKEGKSFIMSLVAIKIIEERKFDIFKEGKNPKLLERIVKMPNFNKIPLSDVAQIPDILQAIACNILNPNSDIKKQKNLAKDLQEYNDRSTSEGSDSEKKDFTLGDFKEHYLKTLNTTNTKESIMEKAQRIGKQISSNTKKAKKGFVKAIKNTFVDLGR